MRGARKSCKSLVRYEVLLFRQHRLKSLVGTCHHLRPSLSVEATRTVRVDGEIRVQLPGLSPHVIVQEEIGGVELLEQAQGSLRVFYDSRVPRIVDERNPGVRDLAATAT